MAGGTSLAWEHPRVKSRVGMTSGTGLGGALENITGMALGTGQAGMRTGQLEGRKIMVKRGRLPGRGGMAAGTGLSKGTIMLISMTGNTAGRRALENIVDMALSTGDASMRAGQFESRNIMIERSRFPG